MIITNKNCLFCGNADSKRKNSSLNSWIAHLKSKIHTKDKILQELILRYNNDPVLKKIVEDNYCCDDAKKFAVMIHFASTIEGLDEDEVEKSIVRKLLFEKEINDQKEE